MINFVINLLLLWTTAKIGRQRVNIWRLIFGASLGAIYAVVIFFPALKLYYTLIAKLLFSMLLVAVAYKIDRVKAFFTLLLLFYMVSFTFGGAALALFYFTNVGAYLGALLSNGVIYINLPWKLLLISTAAAYIVISVGWHLYRRIANRRQLIHPLTLTVGDKTITLDALMDTGNSLYDPMSGLPVVVAEYKAIAPLLPKAVNEIFNLPSDPMQVLSTAAAQDGWTGRMRLIPFASLGQQNGLLVGFKPDRATVANNDLGEIVVAVYLKSLSKDKQYFALLHPEIMVKNEIHATEQGSV